LAAGWAANITISDAAGKELQVQHIVFRITRFSAASCCRENRQILGSSLECGQAASGRTRHPVGIM